MERVEGSQEGSQGAEPAAVLAGSDNAGADSGAKLEVVVEARAGRNAAGVTKGEDGAESVK